MEESQLKIKTVYIAPKFKRFLAFFIDYIPIWILVFLLFLEFTPYSTLFNEYIQKSIEIAQKGETISMEELNPAFLNYSQFINIVSMVVFGLYSAFMETTSRRGTFGKTILKIGVGDFIGKPISGEIAFKRNVIKIITLSIFPLLGLWFIFDSKNRGLHDLLSKTLIVSLKDEAPKSI